MPNLTGYYLDDFFRFGDKPKFNKNSETKPAPAALSLEEIQQLHEETLAYKRRLDLAAVVYTHQFVSGNQTAHEIRGCRFALDMERQ
jgi:hypothetical protein